MCLDWVPIGSLGHQHRFWKSNLIYWKHWLSSFLVSQCKLGIFEFLETFVLFFFFLFFFLNFKLRLYFLKIKLQVYGEFSELLSCCRTELPRRWNMNINHLKLIDSIFFQVICSEIGWVFLEGQNEYSISSQVDWLIYYQVIHPDDRLDMHLHWFPFSLLLWTVFCVCEFCCHLSSIDNIVKLLRKETPSLTMRLDHVPGLFGRDLSMIKILERDRCIIHKNTPLLTCPQ